MSRPARSVGSGTFDDGNGPEPLTLTTTANASTLEFVVYHDDFTTQSGDDDACEDVYEVDVVVHVTSGSALNEAINTVARGNRDDAWLTEYFGLWDEDVTGDLTPTEFDPATAPNPWLLLDFRAPLTAVMGWMSVRDAHPAMGHPSRVSCGPGRRRGARSIGGGVAWSPDVQDLRQPD